MTEAGVSNSRKEGKVEEEEEEEEEEEVSQEQKPETGD